MNADEQYLTELSKQCRLLDTYTRLQKYDQLLREEGVDETTRKNLLEGLIGYVSTGILGEEEKWAIVDLRVRLGVEIKESLAKGLNNLLTPKKREENTRGAQAQTEVQRRTLQEMVGDDSGQYEDMVDEEDTGYNQYDPSNEEYRRITNQDPHPPQ